MPRKKRWVDADGRGELEDLRRQAFGPKPADDELGGTLADACERGWRSHLWSHESAIHKEPFRSAEAERLVTGEADINQVVAVADATRSAPSGIPKNATRNANLR